MGKLIGTETAMTKDEIYVSSNGKETPVSELNEHHMRMIINKMIRTKNENDRQNNNTRNSLLGIKV